MAKGLVCTLALLDNPAQKNSHPVLFLTSFPLAVPFTQAGTTFQSFDNLNMPNTKLEYLRF